jgi:peptide/nickel transport system substrate-binding protein
MLISNLAMHLVELGRRSTAAVIVLVLLVVAGVVPLFAPQRATASSSDSNQLTIGYTNEAKDPFNLITYGDLASYMTNYLIYGSMLLQSPQGTLIPGIASNYTISSNGLRYTFYLNPNATFSDGHPLTSQDVLYTYELIANDSLSQYFDIAPVTIPATNTVTGVTLNMSAVQTPDPHTIVFNLQSPSVPFLVLGFTSFGIFEKNVVQGQNLTNDNFFDQNLSHVVGAGPFGKVLAYEPGQFITLGANPYYYVKGEPHLSQITFKVFKSISDEEIALKDGEIQFIGGGADMQGIDPWDVPLFNGTSGLTVTTEPSVSFTEIEFNQYPHLADGSFNPLSMKNVRQAIYEGFDEVSAIQSVFGSFAVLANQPESPLMSYGGLTAHNPNLPNPLYPYNVTQANLLLNQTGYLWNPVTGNVSNHNPYRFSVNLYIPSGYDAELRIAELFQAQLRQNLGINVNVEIQDIGTLVYEIYGGEAPPHSWNMALYFWDPTPGEPDLALYQWWGPSFNQGAYGLDATDFNSTAFNQLKALEMTTLNPQQRQLEFFNMSNILYHDIPDLFLYYPDYILAYDSNYVGWIPGVQLDMGAVSPDSLANVRIVPTSSTTSSSTVLSTTSNLSVPTSTSATPTASDNVPLYAAVVVGIVVLMGAIVAVRRRRPKPAPMN